MISFLRCGQRRDDDVLVVCNFTPVARLNSCVGLPRGGTWNEIARSDALTYGGSGSGNCGQATATAQVGHGHLDSLPPPALLVLKPLQKIGARS